ncbi:uncharacterized protein LOC132753096 [Ruditapes philippinarum]|uniref:uncharacterized protein LOC132753096 n=1 Tax=Ruditapes philippinarum TaxID=129788 RepID=UPI00295B8725|nr:uncharacterized protein LOC132753096 [Ruditapes philippinarum]
MKAYGIYVCLVLILIFVFGIYNTHGARGGARVRSTSRTRSTSSGTRSSVRSVTRFGTRSSYSGSSYSPGTWKTAAAVGTLYGLSSYKHRRRYYDSPNSEPTVCFNEKNLKNGTYGYFICPEEGQDDDMAYCCGDEDAQTCCEYTDATAVGRIIGIVFGVLAACACVGILVYCVVIQMKRRQRLNGTTYAQNTSTGTASVQYSVNQPYFTNGSNFQYDQKQDMSSYPETANSYDTIGNTEANGSMSNRPIGFEGDRSQPQNGVSGPPPYSPSQYNGFQDTPSAPPPPYPANNF